MNFKTTLYLLIRIISCECKYLYLLSLFQQPHIKSTVQSINIYFVIVKYVNNLIKSRSFARLTYIAIIIYLLFTFKIKTVQFNSNTHLSMTVA